MKRHGWNNNKLEDIEGMKVRIFWSPINPLYVPSHKVGNAKPLFIMCNGIG